ncbi:phosphatidate cytidylyltransferase [Granulicoccus phenolivorans]|uniref:phosphatidate cytidylyltransferase n=1 Tax=Granulicoccus phenolivorans TaxID=266854 RepID=UPI0004144783|nr:phosphatidate cytidylyltransferase [Granulicoccus phenolivorans]
MSEPTAQAPHRRSPGRDLPAAILVAVVLLGLMAVSLLWAHWAFVLLVAVLLTFGVHEVAQALRQVEMRPALWPLAVGTILIVSSSYLVSKFHLVDLNPSTITLSLIGLTALVCLIWRMPGGAHGYVRDAAASMFILGYIPVLGSFVGLLVAGDNGAGRVLTYILIVIAGDTGGYLFGVLFGKHKMAPTISPKKTWEGLAGSFALGIATAIVLAIWVLGVAWWVGLILGVVVVIAGVCGDLIESLIKRDVGLKDMGSVLPGHGGVMDRLDSLLAACPVAWLTMFLLIPGG